MESNRRSLFTIILVVVTLFLIVGATLAYFYWESNSAERTTVSLTFERNLSCSADGGGDISSSDYALAPAACTNPEYAIQRTITTNTTAGASMEISLDLWLNVESISQELLATDNFKYAITTSSDSCTTGLIEGGSFKDKYSNNKVPLLTADDYTGSDTKTYYLYIWLDAAETSASTMNKTFRFTVGGECKELKNVGCPAGQYLPANSEECATCPANSYCSGWEGFYDGSEHGITACPNGQISKAGSTSSSACEYLPNAPVLDAGMIPVTIANNGTVTAVASNNPSWYDYSSKQWANAVLVKGSGVRTRAANSVAGTTIDQRDILAYFVWIPRYSYKIWTIDPSRSSREQTIDIKFVGTNTKETGSAVGEYYTHPAFTFGSEELPGFWVGKFEATGDATTPTILPNVTPPIDQNLSSQFATSLKFAGGTQSGSAVTFAGSSTYGLTSMVDSHMMKNSEWGATLYLSHSNYGINGKIRSNNYWNNGLLTGCGASTDNASESATCGIAYGSATSYPQSTTGNISGIFDMSGGAMEYVMGRWSDSLSAPRSDDSGFRTLPPSKYIDIYPSDIFTGDGFTNVTFCTLATCGGHALYETAGWNRIVFVYSGGPWFGRGGSYNYGATADAFSSNWHWGEAGGDYWDGYVTASWRGVLVAR